MPFINFLLLAFVHCSIGLFNLLFLLDLLFFFSLLFHVSIFPWCFLFFFFFFFVVVDFVIHRNEIAMGLHLLDLLIDINIVVSNLVNLWEFS